MCGCQKGPFLGALNKRCRIIIMSQKGTLILTTIHTLHDCHFLTCRRLVDRILTLDSQVPGLRNFELGLICRARMATPWNLACCRYLAGLVSPKVNHQIHSCNCNSTVACQVARACKGHLAVSHHVVAPPAGLIESFKLRGDHDPELRSEETKL